MKAITLLWIGSIIIFLSVVLQIIAAILSSFSLGMIGLALNAVTVPLTIWQGYRSAIEQQKQFERERREREAQMYPLTEPGQLDIVFERRRPPNYKKL